MNPLQTVLAATDFSEDGTRAARRAALISGEHSARLRLLHVIRSDLLSMLRARLGKPVEVEASLLAQADRSLEKLCSELEAAAGSRPEALVRTGAALDEILAAADHAQVLLLGAHGLRPFQEQLIGTTAERLLRRGRRPMIVVRQEARARYSRVLVAIDFSTQSLGALSFAQQLAPQAQLHLLHAYDFPYEDKLRQADVAPEVMEDLQRQFREEALANMANVVGKWVRNAANATSSVEHGNPKTLIPQWIGSAGADLVVLGKHGYSRVGEYFLGGVTRHVLARAVCDVAVVPDPALS